MSPLLRPTDLPAPGDLALDPSFSFFLTTGHRRWEDETTTKQRKKKGTRKRTEEGSEKRAINLRPDTPLRCSSGPSKTDTFLFEYRRVACFFLVFPSSGYLPVIGVSLCVGTIHEDSSDFSFLLPDVGTGRLDASGY